MSESEERTEVRVDRWADTLPKAGGGLRPFPADSVVDDEEEETEFNLFHGSPSSAAAAEQEGRGCDVGRGFEVFLRRHKEKQNIRKA